MSEPITRADVRSILCFLDNSRRYGNSLDAFDEWCRQHPAESASPPRVPGASAQSYEVGVQSGPGQPTPPYVPDIADALDGWAAQYSEPENINARTLREAAAEIRRLRDRVINLEQFIEGASNRIEALTNATKRGYRAGIEAAAEWHRTQRDKWGRFVESPAGTRADVHRLSEEGIRALADKPAPDAARKGG